MRPPTACAASRLMLLAGVLICASATPAAAKEHGFHSPGGRTIYGPTETFAEVTAQDRRQVVVEIATGLAPEGLLAASVGWLAPELGGLEFYLGVGLQPDPARQYAGSARYWFELAGLKPFVGLGYVYQDHYRLRMRSHHIFSELGYKWRVYHTYHVTLGLGARYLARVVILGGSALRAGTTDPALLQRQLDRLPRFLPTLSLRFSRAF